MSVCWRQTNRNMARGTILNFNPSICSSPAAPRCSPCGRTAPCCPPGRGCPGSSSPPPAAAPPAAVAEDIVAVVVVVVAAAVVAVAVAVVEVDVVVAGEFAGGR